MWLSWPILGTPPGGGGLCRVARLGARPPGDRGLPRAAAARGEDPACGAEFSSQLLGGEELKVSMLGMRSILELWGKILEIYGSPLDSILCFGWGWARHFIEWSVSDFSFIPRFVQCVLSVLAWCAINTLQFSSSISLVAYCNYFLPTLQIFKPRTNCSLREERSETSSCAKPGLFVLSYGFSTWRLKIYTDLI